MNSDSIHGTIDAGENGAKPALNSARRRRVVTPPPLAAEPPRRASRALIFMVFAVVILFAGLAKLTGAPDFLAIGLVMTGVAGLVIFARAIVLDRHTASLSDEDSTRGRAEIETL